jgi:hypothetical protein
VEDQIRQAGLLERGAEGIHQLVRELADEAHGVGQQVVSAVGSKQARGGVEGVEQTISNSHRRAGQGVQQRRLAGVRIAGQRHRWELRALALGPHHGPAGAHLRQLALQRRDPVACQPPVGLDLGLPRAAGADSAAQPFEMRPQPSHPGQVVFELRQLHLELSLGGVGVRGEDVENDRGAVYDRHPQLPLEVSLLARGQLVVAGHQVGVGAGDLTLELLDLPGTQIAVRMGVVAALNEGPDIGDSGRAQQLPELGQLVVAVVVAGGDQVCALAGAPARMVPIGGRLACASVAAALHPGSG